MQIGPALIGMVGRNRRPEDLVEIFDGELQIPLGDGHMGMAQCLFHKVNIAGPEIFLQGEGVAQAVQRSALWFYSRFPDGFGADLGEGIGTVRVLSGQ